MTQTYKDTQGREWELKLTLGLLTHVHEQTKLNLTLPSHIGKVADDPFLFGQVLCALHHRQIAERSLSPEAFRDGFDGELVDRVFRLLLEEIVVFTPAAKQGVLRKLIARMDALETKRIAAADAMIDEGLLERVHDADLARERAELEAELARLTASGSAGSSPASSDSTPPG